MVQQDLTKQDNYEASLNDLNMAVNKCGELRFR
ncbi:hypothetical protein NTG1052_150003 [Candidatus Nitrotoga sp. 1052]|nr:hypothetical protein NTG1052_150003 [Candidatus Nitrotoga sp. 1052]